MLYVPGAVRKRMRDLAHRTDRTTSAVWVEAATALLSEVADDRPERTATLQPVTPAAASEAELAALAATVAEHSARLERLESERPARHLSVVERAEAAILKALAGKADGLTGTELDNAVLALGLRKSAAADAKVRLRDSGAAVRSGTRWRLGPGRAGAR